MLSELRFFFFISLSLAHMGPSSGVAAREAKECYNGMARKPLQESSSLSLKFLEDTVFVTFFPNNNTR